MAGYVHQHHPVFVREKKRRLHVRVVYMEVERFLWEIEDFIEVIWSTPMGHCG